MLRKITENSLYYYTKASELDPESMDCQLNIALKNDMLGNHYEAIALMEELHKKAPDDSEFSGRLAEFYVDAAKRMNEGKNYYDAYNFLLKANNIEDIYTNTREELDKMLGDENLRAKLRSQLNDLNRDNDSLSNDISKKFNEAGEKAYPIYKNSTNEFVPSVKVKSKLHDILAIDTLINSTIQDMENIKGREKKSGFFAKLGDALSSTAKQGKLKIDLYNLERKKKDSFKFFGEALWASKKSGDKSFSELSEIWGQLEEIEKHMHDNDSKIDKINKMLNMEIKEE